MAAKWTPAQLSWFKVAAANNAAAARNAGGMLSPIAEQQYRQETTNANQTYQQGLATNEYNRGQSAQGFNTQRQTAMDAYSKMRDQMPYGANERGVLGGGIWHQELQDATKQQATALGNLEYQRTGALGQFDLLRQQLEQNRAASLAGINSARAAALQATKLGSVQ